MSESIGTARLDIVVDTSSLDAGVTKAKRTTEDMAKAANNASSSMEQNSKRQIASLEKQIATLGKSKDEIIRWRIEQQTSGKVAAELAAKLDTQVAKLKQSSAALGGTAKSAKELQFAMRGLPAQVTDIVTGLATGQRPLNILLQQGGQLKDMFGGVVPAARALGGAIVGLINPFTVSAAAAAALFLAWKQGDDEAVAFRQAIALTGQAAGVTSNELQGMAVAMSNSATTQHEAAAALAEVTKSGKFTADQIRDVADAAIYLERATGQSVEQTIAEFAKLSGDPVKAVVELNDKYHFLTTAVYEQIRALQAQGREEDAVNLAIRTSSAELKKRAADVIANAGLMERAWHSLGSVVRQVWDDIRNAGRASSAISDAQMKVASANSELNALAHRIKVFAANGGVYTPEREAEDRREIARLKKVKADAAKVIEDDPGRQRALQDANKSRATSLAISLQQEADTYKSGLEKLRDAKIKAQGEVDAAVAAARRAGDANALKLAQESGKKILGELDRQIAEAQTRGAAKASGGGGRASRPTTRALPSLDSDAAAKELDRLAQAEQQATDRFLDMQATLQGPLAEALRDHQKRVEQLNALAAQSPVAAAGLNDALAEEAKRYDQATDAIKRQLDPVGEVLRAQAMELDLIGKSNAERDVMNALLEKGIDLRSQDAQAALAQARANQTEAQARQKSIELMDTFRRGASDALTEFVTGAKSAKDALKDFFNSMAEAITRAIAEQWMQKLFGQQGTSQTGSAGGIISGILGMFAGGSANGNAFTGGNVMAFANGGVVNRTTPFGMSGGRFGIMGEAGPEAILPLHRGRDGKLGVRVEAANDSHMRPVQNFNTTFLMPERYSRETQAQIDQKRDRVGRIASARNR